jgi:hypothetical protein
VEVEVDVSKAFYSIRIPSAGDMIRHWEAAVEAGENLLWDSLGDAMGDITKDMLAGYGKSLEETEKIIQHALDKQFEVIKADKETILSNAKALSEKVQKEAQGYSGLQRETLEKRYADG